MDFLRKREFNRTVRTDFGRQQVIELVMTVGIIGMSFALVGLMILRLSGEGQPVAKQPKKKKDPKVVALNHNEVELGQFQVTMTTMKQLMAGPGKSNVHILQFDASVMVQNGTQSGRVEDVFDEYRGRLHATIDTATRSATDEELNDPNLEVFRGKIRSRVNRLIGEDVVDEVVVSNFRYYHF